MKMELLECLYRKSLLEIRDAEAQLLRILPKMASASGIAELKKLFRDHAEETREQLKRLEMLLGRYGGASGTKSKAMAGLVSETNDLLKQTDLDSQLLDASLTAVAQKVEALEITSYACAHNFARLLGFHDDLKPLEETFHEEERMEERLSLLAEKLELEYESEIEIEKAGAIKDRPSGYARHD